MTTKEHLEKIKTKCQELLAIAEKRTAGKWSQGPDNHEGISIGGDGEHYYQLRWNNGQGPNDASFIASCAGPAEGGWRATIAAIDLIAHLSNYDTSVDDSLKYLTQQITAAWPEELI